LKLDADVKNIMRESYDEFVMRIRRTMLSFPREDIDNLICPKDLRLL